MTYLNTIPFYVYKIELPTTGQFYYGSRYNHVKKNRYPESDIWVHYFTSSKLVKGLIQLYGKNAFIATIIHTSDIAEDVFWFEQNIIKENLDNSLCLNKHYIDPDSANDIWCTVGMCRWVKEGQSIWTTECPGDGWIKQGHPHNQESKKKISEAHKGKPKSLAA